MEREREREELGDENNRIEYELNNATFLFFSFGEREKRKKKGIGDDVSLASALQGRDRVKLGIIVIFFWFLSLLSE